MANFLEKVDTYLKENGGRASASKKTFPEMEREIKTNGAERSDGLLEKGRMYAFRYFTPNEMMFDTYPVVIGLGKSIDGHQLGINLHYMPYLTRVQFVNTFINSYRTAIHEQTIGGKANNVKKQSELDIVDYYQIKRAFGRMYNMTYATRQYDLSRMRNPICLSYENWHLGTINDENFFNGTNINEAQSNYFKK
jgi:hypothetical protein